jgi:hypothetical protein
MVEAGSTFGDVARTLNAEGVKSRRGKPWVSRTVRLQRPQRIADEMLGALAVATREPV